MPLMTQCECAESYNLTQHLDFVQVLTLEDADRDRWTEILQQELSGPEGSIWFNSKHCPDTDLPKGLVCQKYEGSTAYAIKFDAKGDGELSHLEARLVGFEE
jgi:hypothetical protein